MIMDGENEIGLNEWNMEDEIMDGSFQMKQNTTKQITNFIVSLFHYKNVLICN